MTVYSPSTPPPTGLQGGTTYQCTPIQEQILRDHGPNAWLSIPLAFPTLDGSSIDNVRYAWQAVAAHNAVLRAIFVPDGKHFRTKVLRHASPLRLGYDASQPEDCAWDHSAYLSLQDAVIPGIQLKLWIHPALIDSTSIAMVKMDFVLFYCGFAFPQHVAHSSYVKYAKTRIENGGRKIKAYWRSVFGGFDVPLLLSRPVPASTHHVETSAIYDHELWQRMAENEADSGISRQALINAAWAVLLSKHCSVDTVVFAGSGRDRSFQNVGSVVGYADVVYPLKATVEASLPFCRIVKDLETVSSEASKKAVIGYQQILQAIPGGARPESLVRYMEGLEEPIDDGTDRRFPLVLVVNNSNVLRFAIRHDDALTTEKAEILLSHFHTILRCAVENPEIPVEEISLASEAEKQEILKAGAAVAQSTPNLIHRMFRDQMMRTPDELAVRFEDSESVSFSRLNKMANLIASQLQCAPGQIIPVCMDRSVRFVASLLAILKKGAAYTILDPETPRDRNNSVVADTNAPFVLSEYQYSSWFEKSVAVEDLLNNEVGDVPDIFVEVPTSNPAYIVFTSGSTGKPKGVVLEHGAATSGIQHFRNMEGLRSLLFYNPIFSAAQRTIWATLLKGGCLCLSSKQRLISNLAAVINEMKIDTVGLTSSTAALLKPDQVPGLKTITLTGENMKPDTVNLWSRNLDLYNAYGLSECTQLNFGRRLLPTGLGSSIRNVGRPRDTTSSYVLYPGTTNLCPLLIPGELCLGGDQLAREYLNRPSETSKKFIPNPFGPGRLYRTGDMAVCMEDGSIEIIGRIDFQMKINGQRVEPGDINAVLQKHPSVSEVSVVAATVGEKKVLVAAIAPANGTVWEQLAPDILSFARNQLPVFMIPNYWMQMAEMPRTPNGKVNVPAIRARAERLGVDGLLLKKSSAVFDSQELLLREAFAETLKVKEEYIGLEDSFLSLGGSSLQAIEIGANLRKRGYVLEVADIIQAKSLKVLAGKVSQISSDEDKAPKAFSLLPKDVATAIINSHSTQDKQLEDAYPATPVQEAMLGATLQGNNSYTSQRVFKIDGANLQRLRTAFESVIAKNPIYRTTFVEQTTGKDGLFLQLVWRDTQLVWTEVEGETVEEYKQKDMQRGMELGEPFIRVAILDSRILIITAHHVLFDFWSHHFLYEDVATAYHGKPLLERPSFNRFVKHTLAEKNQEAASQYWQNYLRDCQPSNIGTSTEPQPHIARSKIQKDLRSFCQSHQVTFGAMVYAAWAIVLGSHTGQSDVVFATALSGRDTVAVSGIQSMNGPTLTTVPQRVKLQPTSSLLDLIKGVQDQLWQMSPHAHLGMRRALNVAGQRATVLDTLVNILVKREDNEDTRGLFKPYGQRPVWNTGFTTLEIEELGANEFDISLISSSLDSKRVSFILDQVTQTLHNMIQEPTATTIAGLDIVAPAEEQFLSSLSQLQHIPEPEFMHRRFELLASRSPEKLALQFLDQEYITYAQLNTRANQLATHLLQQGLQLGDIVPLCMDKSTNAIISMLAILKAGAAYVPLSPENPAERNCFVASEVHATLIITQRPHAELFSELSAKVRLVYVDELSQELSALSEENVIVPGQKPTDTAYLIYTSGSTGHPKGVIVPHASAAAAIASMALAENRYVGVWRTLQFANYVFDASVQDIFNTLSTGGTLCLAPQEDLFSDLVGCINSMDVKQAILTPTVAKLFSPDEVPGFECLILGGEPMTPDIVRTWAGRVRLLNVYGPSETSMVVTTKHVLPGGNPRVIGRAFETVSAVVLEREGRKAVPYGAVGELCVGGPQVTRGYHNRQDLTDKVFVEVGGRRVYKTGDLVRWVSGGEIECFGRVDDQVKINGNRVELREVESAVLSTGIVRHCAAVVTTVKGKQALAAFCVFDTTHDKDECILPAESYRDSVRDLANSLTMLTPYMIPKLWLPVGAFPKLPSRKTDKRALRRWVEALSSTELTQYAGTGEASTAEGPPETKEEELLQKLWSKMFDIDVSAIGRNSTFLSLGGDSISAINLVSQCRREGFRITVGNILATPTLKDMAATITPMEESTGSVSVSSSFVPRSNLYEELAQAGIVREAIEDVYPCAPGQIEFITQSEKEAQFWQLLTVRALPADFDLEKWIAVTREVTKLNSILRTMYVKDDEHTYLQVILRDPVLDLEVIECEPSQQPDLVRKIYDQRFALGKPFVRYRILQYPDGTRDLVIKLDHGSYDGTFFRLLDEQFTAIASGRPLPKRVEFKDFAMHMHSINRAHQLKFWKKLLEGNNKPIYNDVKSPKIDTTRVFKTEDLEIEEFAQTHGVTVPIIFQTAFALVLRARTGQDDITYDNLITGRNVDLEDAQLINGNCANFLPFRSLVSSATTFDQLLKQTQRLFWETTENGGVGLRDIAGALGVGEERKNSRVLFLYQPFEKESGPVDHMRWIVMARSKKIVMHQPYALLLEVSKAGDGFALKVQFDSGVFGEKDAREVADAVVEVVRRMKEDPRREVGEI